MAPQLQISPKFGSCKSSKSEEHYNRGGVHSTRNPQFAVRPVLPLHQTLYLHYIHNNPEGGSYYYYCLQRRKLRHRKLDNLVKVLGTSRRHSPDCNLSSDSKVCVITCSVPGASDNWNSGVVRHLRGPGSQRVWGWGLASPGDSTYCISQAMSGFFLLNERWIKRNVFLPHHQAEFPPSSESLSTYSLLPPMCHGLFPLLDPKFPKEQDTRALFTLLLSLQSSVQDLEHSICFINIFLFL